MMDNDALRYFLQERVEVAYRTRPESFGTPLIDGFELVVLPPYSDYGAEEVLRVNITSCAVCCVVNGAYILMVHHCGDEGGFINRIDIPGGARDPMDSSPLHTANREFYEETGYQLSSSSFEPFSYAFRQKESLSGLENRGGLQYLAFKNIKIPKGATIDEYKRIYMLPKVGANTKEIDQIVLEPIDIFLSSLSALNSPHTWAYRRMFNNLKRRFQRILYT